MTTEKSSNSARTDGLATDGFSNQITGIQMRGRDPGVYNAVTPVTILSDEQVAQLFDGDTLARQAITLPIDAEFRAGYEIHSSDFDAEQLNEIYTYRAEKGVDDAMITARYWEAAGGSRGGGSAILLGIDDGQTDFSQPVNESAIKRIKYMIPMEASKLEPSSIVNLDPTSDNYLKPETYRLTTPSSHQTWHRSRMIIFPGLKCTSRTRERNNGWGLSRYQLIYQRLGELSTALSASSTLIQKFVSAVFKVRGLVDAIAANNDGYLANRLANMEFARSIINAIVLEEGEEFELKTVSVSGLADLIEMAFCQLSQVTEIPMIILFSREAKGLSATSTASMQQWYEAREAAQESINKPALQQLYRYIFLAKEGPTKGKLPKSWTLEFNPIRHVNQMEEAQIHLTQAQADAIYSDMGVITTSEIRNSRFATDGFSVNTTLDDEQSDLLEEIAEAELEAKLNAVEEPADAPDAQEKTPQTQVSNSDS